MADPSQSTSTSTTTITDLNVDSLAHCASYLSLQDVSNVAMTCKYLKRVAYSDSVWQRWFREQWKQGIHSSQTLGVREAYLSRRTSLQQFKFIDPLIFDIYTEAKPHDHMLLDKSHIFFSQGSLIQMMKMDSLLSGRCSLVTLNDHNARITCMRWFPLSETTLVRSGSRTNENVLISSSCDHSIRLWWKGTCQRCFRGHNGPVSALSDKLLGDGTGKVLASGGEDGTVRLWSLNSSGKRGQHALKATLHGHEKPIKLISVAGHKTSLLATISKDSKVRIWDTTTSTAVRSSCCVGMTSLCGAPVNMKCHETLLYAAAGSSVVVIDLRTMQKVMTVAICQSRLHSFEAMPSKSLICTGSEGRAMLWDIRRNQDMMKPNPTADLDGHTGPVTFLHMDTYKIVTSSNEDMNINIWEVNTGAQTNSMVCGFPEEPISNYRCSAMAVDGFRMVSASCGREQGLVRFWDFTNASCPISKCEDSNVSKFWNSQSYNDAEYEDPIV